MGNFEELIKIDSECNDIKHINNTNEIFDNSVKCPYCDKIFKNYNGLCKHVIGAKKHGEISREQLLVDFAYNGVRPTCKCGCGEYTDISYQGGAHFCDYVLGHASRVHNNWGHNENAKNNSAETRRQQYKNGDRIQWNKGKSWEETFSDEKIKELMESYKNPERCEKISKAMKGVPKSEEHVAKQKEIYNTDKYKKIFSDNLLKRIKNNKFTLSSKLEDNFVEEFIKPLNLEYERQYYIKDIKQYCDVYIPSKNLIIECDGSFWHCDPRLFPDGAVYEYQEKKIERDEIKNKFLKENGYNLLRFWELDILNNKELVKNQLLDVCNEI